MPGHQDWLTEPELFGQVLLKDFDPVTSLILLTPMLERSLGDYLWSGAKGFRGPIPSLLRDLLKVPELSRDLGKELMLVAR